jgi:predicted enzyme related to lactoylglutathione lyase
MLNLSSVMLGTTQPEKMVAFYANVLGKPADMVDADNGISGWQSGKSFLAVLKHSEMGGSAKDPGRVMFIFETADVKAECDRIKAAGATVIREPYSIGEGFIATLADPDGNYFQLMNPM